MEGPQKVGVVMTFLLFALLHLHFYRGSQLLLDRLMWVYNMLGSPSVIRFHS
jgi:hypothetical protein